MPQDSPTPKTVYIVFEARRGAVGDIKIAQVFANEQDALNFTQEAQSEVAHYYWESHPVHPHDETQGLGRSPNVVV